MGSQGSKVSLKKSLFRQNKTHLETDIKCPNCQVLYPKGAPFEVVIFQSQKKQFKIHVGACLNMQDSQGPINDYIKGIVQTNKIKQSAILQDYLYQKIPQNPERTKFKWEKQPIKPINHDQLIKLSPQQMKTHTFQEKNYWFRYHQEKKRVNWTQGADFMKIQRTNVLMSSLIAYPKVNMHKQVKIEFFGDKVNDAGGLLREWIHMVIKEVFDQETGIFSVANTDEIMYKLKWDQDLDQQFSTELFTLFGVIVGKAIFQKIPILSYLDRTILRQITGRPVQMEDIFGFDKGLYQSWNFLLNNEINNMGLQTYFTVNKEDDQNTVQQIELIENGSQTEVTDVNKQLYIQSCKTYLTETAVKRSIDAIRKGIFKVIQKDLISIFQPYELEMLLYGVPFIDANDWRLNTDYKGEFNEQNQVILWFWSVVQEFDQEQLANFLHFCTGSSRTPIQGFKKLQSNRGTVGKFLIESSPFDHKNPYPKGHTCFNRLELPIYPDKGTLELYVKAVANSHLDGIFGLD